MKPNYELLLTVLQHFGFMCRFSAHEFRIEDWDDENVMLVSSAGSEPTPIADFVQRLINNEVSIRNVKELLDLGSI